jgi:hypothetical protein
MIFAKATGPLRREVEKILGAGAAPAASPY